MAEAGVESEHESFTKADKIEKAERDGMGMEKRVGKIEETGTNGHLPQRQS